MDDLKLKPIRREETESVPGRIPSSGRRGQKATSVHSNEQKKTALHSFRSCAVYPASVGARLYEDPATITTF